MDRRLELLPPKPPSSPATSTSPTALPSSTHRKTRLQPQNAPNLAVKKGMKTAKRSAALGARTEAERAPQNTPGAKAALPGVSTPTRSLTPSHCVGKLWNKRKFPRVKNTEQKQQRSGDAAWRRGVFPPNIHTYTPPFTTTTTPLPPSSATRTRRNPRNPPTSQKLQKPPDLPGRAGAEKSNQIFKSTVPRALPLLPFFFFFVSSHQT